MKRLLLVSLVLVLAACGDPEPPLTEGKVIDRTFTPEHWEDGYDTEYYNDCGLHYDWMEGEYVFDCRPATRRVYEAHHVWREDTWKIHIRGCTTDEKGKEDCRTDWITVGQDLYDQCILHRLYRQETGCLPQ